MPHAFHRYTYPPARTHPPHITPSPHHPTHTHTYSRVCLGVGSTAPAAPHPLAYHMQLIRNGRFCERALMVALTLEQRRGGTETLDFRDVSEHAYILCLVVCVCVCAWQSRVHVCPVHAGLRKVYPCVQSASERQAHVRHREAKFCGLSCCSCSPVYPSFHAGTAHIMSEVLGLGVRRLVVKDDFLPTVV